MRYRERLEKIKNRLTELEQELVDPVVMKQTNTYQALMKEAARLRPVVESFETYRKIEQDIEDARKGLKTSEADDEMKTLFQEEVHQLEIQLKGKQKELESLLLQESDANAGRDVIVEIRAGTGGEEAALFASDLFRMYSRYAGERGFRVEILSSNPTGKGGFKELIFGITGNGVYPAFKYESGIHRVQRVPETESSGRIHTSAVTVAVLPEAAETEIDIEPKDLRIDVFRASGAGGQHVNKTESAVRITHIPTGMVVSCQDERSQHKNKAKALRVLRARIYEMRQAAKEKEMAKFRKEQVGSGDRSGKIRTYNFLERRVTDHRIGLTLHDLDDILDGHLDEIIEALSEDERNRRLNDAA